jgi:hypothetical protein
MPSCETLLSLVQDRLLLEEDAKLFIPSVN